MLCIRAVVFMCCVIIMISYLLFTLYIFQFILLFLSELSTEVAALLLPLLFKADNVSSLYTTDRDNLSNSPTICFAETPVSASHPPASSITLDSAAVLQTEEKLDFSSLIACLICVYYIYNIQYAPGAANTLKFIQHHLLHLEEDKSPAIVKRMATYLSKAV